MGSARSNISVVGPFSFCVTCDPDESMRDNLLSPFHRRLLTASFWRTPTAWSKSCGLSTVPAWSPWPLSIPHRPPARLAVTSRLSPRLELNNSSVLRASLMSCVLLALHLFFSSCRRFEACQYPPCFGHANICPLHFLHLRVRTAPPAVLELFNCRTLTLMVLPIFPRLCDPRLRPSPPSSEASSSANSNPTFASCSPCHQAPPRSLLSPLPYRTLPPILPLHPTPAPCHPSRFPSWRNRRVPPWPPQLSSPTSWPRCAGPCAG